MRMGILGGCLAVLAVLGAGPAAHAIEVSDLKGFEPHFGRYAPAGDCSRQPQVVIDPSGFGFEGGPVLPKATRPEYAASYMGNSYEGSSLFFFPYTAQPRPLLLTLNAGEQAGVLTIEGYDHDYPGGPALPGRYRPYIAASPYLRCAAVAPHPA